MMDNFITEWFQTWVMFFSGLSCCIAIASLMAAFRSFGIANKSFNIANETMKYTHKTEIELLKIIPRYDIKKQHFLECQMINKGMELRNVKIKLAFRGPPNNVNPEGIAFGIPLFLKNEKSILSVVCSFDKFTYYLGKSHKVVIGLLKKWDTKTIPFLEINSNHESTIKIPINPELIKIFTTNPTPGSEKQT